jgi:leader peptidase (prepilin peptidase)/N-methyltransferase
LEGRHDADAKLIAVIPPGFAGAAGFWIGWQGIPIMLLSASLLALTVVVARLATQQGLDLRAQLPFGPFLCAGTFLAWLLISAPS